VTKFVAVITTTPGSGVGSGAAEEAGRVVGAGLAVGAADEEGRGDEEGTADEDGINVVGAVEGTAEMAEDDTGELDDLEEEGAADEGC
jgi:hypothetical protein